MILSLLRIKRLRLPKEIHFLKLRASSVMELGRKTFGRARMLENQLSVFLCLKKIGKRELLNPINAVVDRNADRLVLLSATVKRKVSQY
jgi:hypothetical protein